MTDETQIQAPQKAKRPRKAAAAKPAETRKPKKAAKAAAPAAEASGPRGKIGVVAAMLKRPQGASVVDMMQATGWQAHSVRGALAGAIKKKLGLKVTSEKTEAGRIYRIEAADDAG